MSEPVKVYTISVSSDNVRAVKMIRSFVKNCGLEFTTQVAEVADDGTTLTKTEPKVHTPNHEQPVKVRKPRAPKATTTNRFGNASKQLILVYEDLEMKVERKGDWDMEFKVTDIAKALEQYGYKPSTAPNTLSLMMKAGMMERPSRGVYKLIKQGEQSD